MSRYTSFIRGVFAITLPVRASRMAYDEGVPLSKGVARTYLPSSLNECGHHEFCHRSAPVFGSVTAPDMLLWATVPVVPATSPVLWETAEGISGSGTVFRDDPRTVSELPPSVTAGPSGRKPSSKL